MSDKRQVQIIPPPRLPTEAHRMSDLPAICPPRVNPGGIIDSTLTRWEANRHARTINAVSTRVRAETELFDAQTQALASYIKRQRAFQELQELPEILANDRECRHADRAERLRQHQHASEMAELKRATEIAYGQAALLDARQALKAQRDFGWRTTRSHGGRSSAKCWTSSSTPPSAASCSMRSGAPSQERRQHHPRTPTISTMLSTKRALSCLRTGSIRLASMRLLSGENSGGRLLERHCRACEGESQGAARAAPAAISWPVPSAGLATAH